MNLFFIQTNLHISFRIDLATDPSKKADIAAVVMHEGLCHLCLLTSAMTITRSRIERRMPKKKQGDSLYSKARAKFFEEIYEAIKTHINFSLVKVVLLGSPGFLKVNDIHIHILILILILKLYRQMVTLSCLFKIHVFL
jgi:stalled ribosome rescue protein Dom34